MKIVSPAFENNQLIPPKYTCDGQDINPSLKISDVPETAQSLVLIIDDPDSPTGLWAHWLVWNINPLISRIEENSLPEGGAQGLNDFGKQAYGGPCPGSGQHRYRFKIYALDKKLELGSETKQTGLEKAMADHILDSGELAGLYQRK